MVMRQVDMHVGRQTDLVRLLITVTLLIRYLYKQADVFSVGQEPGAI
jgi:hypothetical protein